MKVMSARIVVPSFLLLLVTANGCLDRKAKPLDSSLPEDVATPDATIGPGGDGRLQGAEASGLDSSGELPSATGTPEAGPQDLVQPSVDSPGSPDVVRDEATLLPDAPPDAPAVEIRPADLPLETGVADLAVDLPPDAPTTGTDAPGTCPPGQKICAGGTGSCIDAACCTAADCPGLCQTCNASHACVAAVTQVDPNGRCLGTCDSTGACKSKQGQSCTAVAGGCVTGTTCSPDGICCESACTSPCMACDIASSLGLCKAVTSGSPHGSRANCGSDPTCGGSCAGNADGSCSYPSKNCGSGPSCSGTDSLIGQDVCSQGTCSIPTAQTCARGFTCVSGACRTTCASDSDCQPSYFCQNNMCHAKAVQVSVGAENVCAVDITGAVYCWGRNLYGILGQDPATVTNSATPIKITGLTSVKGVGVGGDFACALLTTGNVYCWGYGGSGQLGSTPSASYSTSPLAVVGLPSGITGLSVGSSGACVVTSGNALWCWGDNIYKELSASLSANYSATPVNIGLAGTATVAVGDSTICAIASSSAYCWGNNSNGQSGSSGGGSVTAPTGVSGLGGASYPQSISTSGYSSCAVISGGGVDCWGWNQYNALGNTSVANGADSPSAIPVQGLPTGAAAVSVGFLHACAVLIDKTVACWGLERYGEIGDGVTSSESYTTTSSALTALGTITSMSSSSYHSCAVRTNGSLACWGYGYWGEMGNGSTSDASSPVAVTAW
jgi:alpha-tubulin suppressor-like RCC1 family protein